MDVLPSDAGRALSHYGRAHHGALEAVQRTGAGPAQPAMLPPLHLAALPETRGHALRSVMRAPSGLLPRPPARTPPHPSGKTDDNGMPLHAFTETFVRAVGYVPICADVHGADVQVHTLHACVGGPCHAHVIYARTDSREWLLPDSAGAAVIDAVRARVAERGAQSDGASHATSPAGGLYVGSGSSTRNAVRSVPGVGRKVPVRHVNSLDPCVQAIGSACAPIMAAAATLMHQVTPHVLDAMWAPMHASPTLSELFMLPSRAMQDGRRLGEFGAVRPLAPRSCTIPTQHWAARVTGVCDDGSREQVSQACDGLSNHHTDPVDAARGHGMPIIFLPRFSARARSRVARGAGPDHALPCTDLILAENTCGERVGGGRLWRITVCTLGFVCIVVSHYECMAHGNVFPDVGGEVHAPGGQLHLASLLPCGVELLRLVCYSLTAVDSFVDEFERVHQSLPVDGQLHLLRALHASLDHTLRRRLEQMYPALVS